MSRCCPVSKTRRPNFPPYCFMSRLSDEKFGFLIGQTLETIRYVKYRFKDTCHFLEKLPRKTFRDGISITADITSLYTNISTASGLKAFEYYLDAYPQLLPRMLNKNFVLESFKFLQENLFFIFDGEVYRQTKGTGMGKIWDEIITPSSGSTASQVQQPNQRMKIYCVTTFDPAKIPENWYSLRLKDITTRKLRRRNASKLNIHSGKARL